jgi:7-carboxy-7-deazaguanine synthase
MVVTEIYKSIQGESTYAGQPCVFVRTTGCNLRCGWCDSPFSFYGGREMDTEAVLDEIRALDCRLVEITGGEPLLHKDIPVLVRRLLDEAYGVLVETSGSLDIRGLDPRAVLIMDIKCPGSGMSETVRWDNLEALKPTDQVKFVILNRADYDWAREVVSRNRLTDRFAVLFSPVFGEMEPKRLAEWILQDGLPVRFQLQIHKYIWHPETRRV